LTVSKCDVSIVQHFDKMFLLLQMEKVLNHCESDPLFFILVFVISNTRMRLQTLCIMVQAWLKRLISMATDLGIKIAMVYSSLLVVYELQLGNPMRESANSNTNMISALMPPKHTSSRL